jgi:ABC-type multidrug transport system ATPase subunit
MVFGKPPTMSKIKKRIGYLPEESLPLRVPERRETLDYYGEALRARQRARGSAASTSCSTWWG